MYTFDTISELLKVVYRSEVCIVTGRRGIRPTPDGDVFAVEWRSPDGIFFWRETGTGPNPIFENYEGFRLSSPDDSEIYKLYGRG